MGEDFRSFLASERGQFINYVRSLIAETATMEAEDIVQDVLVKLLERRDTAPSLDGLAAYTYRALRNRVIDKSRTEKPKSSLDAELEGSDEITLFDVLEGADLEPADLLESEEGRLALFEALDQLSEIERTVVVSHELEGIPFKELVARLDIPQNTLLSHKSRGLNKLKQIFVEP